MEIIKFETLHHTFLLINYCINEKIYYNFNTINKVEKV
jgi:hypothetical protein